MDRYPSSSLPAARIVFLGIAGFVALLVFLSFSPIAIVPAGHVGVMTVFGRVTGQIIKEGINVVNPLAQTHLMTIRTQEIKETTAVPSREGLILRMESSLLYHVDPAQAANLYQRVGEEYIGVIVEPLLRSSIREATAENSANALYTGGRELVAQRIQEELRKSLAPRGSSSKTCCCATSNCPRLWPLRSKRSRKPSRRRCRWSTCSPRKSRRLIASESRRRESRISSVS
jgi:regulator of protease activity HflC (stomatin/prohibitin superfamily)